MKLFKNENNIFDKIFTLRERMVKTQKSKLNKAIEYLNFDFRRDQPIRKLLWRFKVELKMILK